MLDMSLVVLIRNFRNQVSKMHFILDLIIRIIFAQSDFNLYYKAIIGANIGNVYLNRLESSVNSL